jgi:hypothetical protein
MKKQLFLLLLMPLLSFLQSGTSIPTPIHVSVSTPPTTTQFFASDFNNGTIWPGTDGKGNVAKLTGIRLWDDKVKWGQVNTASGVYDWSNLDAWIAKAQAQHLDVLYTVGDTPAYATKIPLGEACASPGPYSCGVPTDLNPDGTGTDNYYKTFMTALVTRYKGKIAYYEFWNEHDAHKFWSGNENQMVRMCKDAAAIVRSVDPAAKILSPSVHGPTMFTTFDTFITLGGGGTFDYVNVHMRGQGDTNTMPESFLAMYGDTTSEMMKRGINKPIVDGEWGILVNQLTDPDMLASFWARSLVLRASVQLFRQYQYQWDSKSPYGLQGSTSGTAWNVVASWLTGKSVLPCATAGGIYTCAVGNGTVAWNALLTCSNGTCQTKSYTVKQGAKSYGDVTGKTTAITGKTIPLGVKPLYIQ